MRSKWPHIDAPRHLTLPTVDGIAASAGESMRVVEATDRDPGSLHWENFAWHYLVRKPTISPAIDNCLAFGGAVAGRLSSSIDRRTMKGAAYTVVLKRTAP